MAPGRCAGASVHHSSCSGAGGDFFLLPFFSPKLNRAMHFGCHLNNLASRRRLFGPPKKKKNPVGVGVVPYGVLVFTAFFIVCFFLASCVAPLGPRSRGVTLASSLILTDSGARQPQFPPEPC